MRDDNDSLDLVELRQAVATLRASQDAESRRAGELLGGALGALVRIFQLGPEHEETLGLISEMEQLMAHGLDALAALLVEAAPEDAKGAERKLIEEARALASGARRRLRGEDVDLDAGAAGVNALVRRLERRISPKVAGADQDHP